MTHLRRFYGHGTLQTNSQNSHKTLHVGITPGFSKDLNAQGTFAQVQIFAYVSPQIDFLSTSNSDSPRNSLHNELSLASVRDFLHKIKPNYIFASIVDAIDLEFGFSRVDFRPKGSKSKQIVVIHAKT